MLRTFIAILFSLFTLVACRNQQPLPEYNLPTTDLTSTAFIPLPQEIRATNTAFPLDKESVIYTNSDDYKPIARYLSQQLSTLISDTLLLNPTDNQGPKRGIYFEQFDSLASHEEAYQLTISTDSILIQSTTPEGAFRGVQTLLQTIPQNTIDTLADWSIYPIPTGRILDYPSYSFRSSMLDVSRHFFTVDEVKRYIDLLSYYKINHLHLHLSDDQGWRIEIKAWPKLTEIGGQTEVGGGEGGFYTQQEYQDIVQYAADRFMTIIPEIDMPGHTNAASLSYPFLNGNGKELSPYTGMKVGFSTFDTRKDSVYTFIDEVIGEIAALTPGPYFHIGGDESHVTLKDDYNNFVNRVEGIVQKHGKQMIGWDEIVTANVDTTSIAQFWSSEDNALRAAEKGMKVILSPAKKVYLDMKYDESSKYGLNWAAYITPKDAYDWQPSRYVKIPNNQILGIEAPLWSETISNSAEMEYLAFPRVIGVAELGWTEESKLNWADYQKRLAAQTPFLERNHVQFFRHEQIDWQEVEE